MIHPIIHSNKGELIKLCEEFDIKTMYVFGSVTSIEKFDTESDVDFLIAFKNDISAEKYSDNYFDLHYKLELLLGRKIDLVTNNSLKNPYFIESVNKHKELIYEC